MATMPGAGEVAGAMVAVGGTASAGGAQLIAMTLAKLVTMVVSVAICCASSALALDGTLPAMFALEMCNCIVLGRMVRICCLSV